MADEEKKVDEAEAPVTEQNEKVEEAPKAEAAEKPAKAEKADKAEKKVEKASKPVDYTPRLKADYDERIVPAMTERFGYKNRFEVPRL
jgi:large subunit ribosomal protein L5